MTLEVRGNGTVPCEFQILVHEASHVPKGVRSMSVAWRKGVQVVSTGQAEVDAEESTVQWDSTISVSCMLFLSGGGAAQGAYESKLCWLEVSRDGGAIIGHAQLDLADFCDGKPHAKVLQVWKPNKQSANSATPVRMRVTITASWGHGGRKDRAATTHSMSVRRRAKRVGDAHVDQLDRVSKFHSCGSEDPDSRWRNVDVNKDAEAESAIRNTTWPSSMFPVQAGGSATVPLPQPHPPAERLAPATPFVFLEATSRFAGTLNELPARLLATCNRQCRFSGLSSAEQEDAMRIFLAALHAQVLQTNSSCGVLFSTAPIPAVALHASRAVARAGGPISPSGPSESHSMSPRAPTSSHSAPVGVDVASSVAAAAVTSTVPDYPLIMPGVPPVYPAHEAEHVPHTSNEGALDLHEMLNYLSDVKCLALFLAGTQQNAGSEGGLADQSSLSLPSYPMSRGQTSTPNVMDLSDTAAAVGAESASSAADGSQVVSQVIHGVDQALNLGERALRKVDDQLGMLIAHLNDVMQDREIWLQRFQAMREFQMSWIHLNNAAATDLGPPPIGVGPPVGVV